jgi:hypothetical protein
MVDEKLYDKVDEKLYGKWEYDVVSYPFPDINNFFKDTVSRMLNKRWQIHGTPFVMGNQLCQVLVKFTPPEQPPSGPVEVTPV